MAEAEATEPAKKENGGFLDGVDGKTVVVTALAAAGATALVKVALDEWHERREAGQAKEIVEWEYPLLTGASDFINDFRENRPRLFQKKG